MEAVTESNTCGRTMGEGEGEGCSRAVGEGNRRTGEKGQKATGHVWFDPLEETVIPCAVCNGRANGFHYGADTCAACKIFFRRNVGRDLRHKCKRGVDPEGTSRAHVDRNRDPGETSGAHVERNRIHDCRRCRLEQCLSAGMYLDGSRKGRCNYQRKHEYIMRSRSLVQKIKQLGEPTNTKASQPKEMANSITKEVSTSAISSSPDGTTTFVDFIQEPLQNMTPKCDSTEFTQDQPLNLSKKTQNQIIAPKANPGGSVHQTTLKELLLEPTPPKPALIEGYVAACPRVHHTVKMPPSMNFTNSVSKSPQFIREEKLPYEEKDGVFSWHDGGNSPITTPAAFLDKNDVPKLMETDWLRERLQRVPDEPSAVKEAERHLQLYAQVFEYISRGVMEQSVLSRILLILEFLHKSVDDKCAQLQEYHHRLIQMLCSGNTHQASHHINP